MEESNLKRAANFSEEEIDILSSIAEKYRNQIECRSKRTNTNRMKDMIWHQIAQKFNKVSSDLYRGPKTLRIKYKNLKKRAQEINSCNQVKIKEETIDADMESVENVKQEEEIAAIYEYESMDENDSESNLALGKDMEMGYYSEDENGYKKAIKFSSREKRCLLALVDKFMDRIECKKLDSESINLKNIAWAQLAKEYNNIMTTGTSRSVKALRMKYKNIKRERKMKKALEHFESTSQVDQYHENNVEFIIIDSSTVRSDGEEIAEVDRTAWVDENLEAVGSSTNEVMYEYDSDDDILNGTKCEDVSVENELKREKYGLEISLLRQQLEQEKVEKTLLVQKHVKEMENLDLQNQKLKLELEILKAQQIKPNV
ncbi:PREDICTED: myb/SANT-like DNA-binding domain-containing protein 3 isoform X2 [Nicrophorus vespilloides]|uniref:Regulatory protein zeste n=1 Tax=Nicrophorus vespilloides TaxID=110193 RepID=A0ABM1NBI6_NICVS|nr:PREDICTED: myb/SANT-like DNA-binding domain-containing protein 3 isoform X2 [Nicrophorus vespilloides]